MSKLSKISFVFAGLSIITFGVAKLLLGGWLNLYYVLIVFSAVFLIAPFVIDRQFFYEFFTMKTTKHGMNMGLMIILVLVFLGLVNFISVRHYKTWDFSVSQSNTLADQSTKLLKSLQSDLKVTFFYKKGAEGNEENRRQFRELIKKYQDQSDKIRLDFVEVNERPDLAEKYGVTKGSGIVFLEYSGRKNRIEKIEEQEITSALVKVTREKDKTIYFVSGHGEADLDEAKDAAGAGALKGLLENNRYILKTIALNVNPKIPDDADLVMIVGPQHQFLDLEIAALQDYLKKGGNLLIAVKSKSTSGLEKITKPLGLDFENNIVLNIVETAMGKGVNQGPTMAPVFSQTNEITKVFGKNEVVLFRYPTSLKKLEKIPDGVTVEEIVKTPASAMAFPNLEIKGEGPTNQYTMMAQIKGNFPGAEKTKNFNLIVAGDSAFLTNSLLYQSLNRDITLNSVASLAKEENLISITPKEAQVTKMMMNETKYYLFIFGFLVPLPLLLLSTSVGLWLRRRYA